uniref:Taste receptor type 2 n=1 Tax=Pyxicephalus adspersus TaxID=30357 RepID=A0AAV3A5X0_PYXAD|nr:TPA: hypothetical protein GDO54_014779 [Pyxicephalus adspersus]
MLSQFSLRSLIYAVLGLVLAIPPNTCIVIVNLKSIRKKEKLSPSNLIFLVKAIVNIFHQCLLSLQGMLFFWSSSVFHDNNVYSFIMVSVHFLIYYSFWLTVWLSAHYCTSITNLRIGFFIMVKRIVSNFLSHVLFLTALGLFPVSVLIIWAFSGDSNFHSHINSTEATADFAFYYVIYSFLVPVTFLGCILPFCLILLCLLLTFSFLVRHVWRVKNNDSGSTLPNLRAHVTALRTIILFLLVFTSFFMSQVILFTRNTSEYAGSVDGVIWTFRLFSPSLEGFIIFQANNKLKRFILRKLWT